MSSENPVGIEEIEKKIENLSDLGLSTISTMVHYVSKVVGRGDIYKESNLSLQERRKVVGEAFVGVISSRRQLHRRHDLGDEVINVKEIMEDVGEHMFMSNSLQTKFKLDDFIERLELSPRA